MSTKPQPGGAAPLSPYWTDPVVYHATYTAFHLALNFHESDGGLAEKQKLLAGLKELFEHFDRARDQEIEHLKGEVLRLINCIPGPLTFPKPGGRDE